MSDHNSPGTPTRTKYTIGEEIMRTYHSGSPVVKDMKGKFAELFNQLSDYVVKAEEAINSSPKIFSDDSIKSHMETIRKSEELMRCMSEAGKYLELACMWSVKAVTA